MGNVDAFKIAERFMDVWNKDHFYQNVLDIQVILCLDDSQEKLIRLRRRQKNLAILKTDLAAENIIGNRSGETRRVFRLLEVQVQQKTELCARAIETLSNKLVEEAMSVWLHDLLSRSEEMPCGEE
jgi:hypothetical protein